MLGKKSNNGMENSNATPAVHQRWDLLTEPILTKIFRLFAWYDRINFEHVCTRWRNSVSYADCDQLINLSDVYGKIRKVSATTKGRPHRNEESQWKVVDPSALLALLELLHKRTSIVKLQCGPVDKTCEKYNCKQHTWLPYIAGYDAQELLDETLEAGAVPRPARYWILDAKIVLFLAANCASTLQEIDLTHCITDDTTLTNLTSQQVFPHLDTYSCCSVCNDEAPVFSSTAFPALLDLSLSFAPTVLPAQLTSLCLIDLAYDFECFNISYLEQCPNLQSLYLVNFYFIHQQFSKKEFVFDKLETLIFKQTSFEYSHDMKALISILGASPNLTTFFWGMVERVGDRDFDPSEMFTLIPNLRTLGLSCCGFTVERLAHLQSLSHLMELSVEFHTTVSMKSLSTALGQGVPLLSKLTLMSPTDDGSISLLNALPHLHKLRFGSRCKLPVSALLELPQHIKKVHFDSIDLSNPNSNCNCLKGITLKIGFPENSADRNRFLQDFVEKFANHVH